jgi:hypothetical protein
MDWARAKTILIIAFIVTNIFLGYNVWQTKYYGYQDARIKEERIGEVISILEAKGIKVNCSIPRDIFIKGILTVEYMDIVPEELASHVFGKDKAFPIKQENSVKYMNGNKVLEIKNKREIYYTDLDQRSEPEESFTEHDAIKIGEGFLKNLNLYRRSMVVGEVVPTRMGYSVNFVQEYKGKLVEISFVQMEVTSKGVYSMHMLWLNPLKMDSSRKRIIPAVEALIKAVSKKEISSNTPTIIDSIKLIYYFDWEDAKEGEAFPVWKIRLNGENYYINALTGQFN